MGGAAASCGPLPQAHWRLPVQQVVGQGAAGHGMGRQGLECQASLQAMFHTAALVSRWHTALFSHCLQRHPSWDPFGDDYFCKVGRECTPAPSQPS